MDAQEPHRPARGRGTASADTLGDMTTSPQAADAPRDDRDQAVRRAGRLRRTLVGTAAAGSLGLAAVLGTGALGQSSASPSANAAQSGSSSSTSSDTSSSSTTGSGSTSVASGSGSTHATTSGS